MLGTTGATFASTVCTLLGVMYTIEWLLGVASFAIFMVGIIKFMRNAGSTTNQKQGYQMMAWGLLALFVIFSLQGILWLFYNSLIGTSTPGSGGSCGASSSINSGGVRNTGGTPLI